MSEQFWAELRQLFPILRSKRYFAACSQGPLCTRVEGAIARFMDSWRFEGNPWEAEWIPTVSSAADKFARLVSAPEGSVGVTASVSAALAAILSALDFTRRPKVVTSALEFPTIPDILLAYRHKGVIELEVLPEVDGDVPLDLYAGAIDERTGLVCLSTVSYATGVQLPVQQVVELAHQRGALCLVDAYQSAGALVCDIGALRPDFLVTGTLKYLLGTSGVGLIYVAPDLAGRLEPRDIGWMAAANPFGVNFDHLEYAAGGARFQGGTFTIPGCYAAEAALDLLLDVGPGRIQERVLRLTQRFAEQLLDMGVRPIGPTQPGKLGPMVAVPVPGNSLEWQERLRQEEMLVTSARGRAIRFAFHLYNNDEDVDACLATVRKHFRPGRTRA